MPNLRKDIWLPRLGAQMLVILVFLPWLPAMSMQVQQKVEIQQQGTNWVLEIIKLCASRQRPKAMGRQG